MWFSHSKKPPMATPPPPFVLLLLLIFSSLPTGKPDLQSDKAALLAFRAAVGRSVLPWREALSPCAWKGVVCDTGSVAILRLPGVGLVGRIPDGVFGNLTGLRTLSLRFNALSGSLPADLAACTQLRNLYLQENRFSGEIPAVVFSLQNLIRLNLAGNNFSGGISPGFNRLRRVKTLYLDRNQLSGQIPDLNNLTLDQFNVSFNRLNGSIPKSLRGRSRDEFLGMSLCGLKSNPCPGEAVPSPAPGGTSPSDNGGGVGQKKKLSGGVILAIAVGSFLAVSGLVLLLCFLCRKKDGSENRPVVGDAMPPDVEAPNREKRTGEGAHGAAAGSYSGTAAAVGAAAVAGAEREATGSRSKKLTFFGEGPRVFVLEDLLRASAEVLGKGTFGTAFKAVLQVGITVVVKRLRDVNLTETEFRKKIMAVGAMVHPNLVPLQAYYYSKDEKLLVYDYMPMGSLSALLHGSRGTGHSPLHWGTRVNIALSAARGVEYIHSTGPGASHGNIKSSNILFAKAYDARVSDHGLAHLAGPATLPSRLAGYRAPEVADARKVSQKADVYSFGVLLLELVTGKAPAQVLPNEGVDLPRWVESVVRDELAYEVFDSELLRNENVEEEMVRLLRVAIDCVEQHPDKRPAMSQVVARVEEIQRRSVEAQERGQQQQAAAASPPHSR